MKPTDNRARVVHELLETERKYVQDMEVLQVNLFKILRRIFPYCMLKLLLLFYSILHVNFKSKKL